MKSWWLSFADQGGFRGAVICDGNSMGEALQQANRLHLNPGGEVAGCELTLEMYEMYSGIENRLITKEELELLGERSVKDSGGWEAFREDLEVFAVCEECNERALLDC